MKRSTRIDIISSLFILLFVYTALTKITEPAKFKWALEKSPLIANYSTLITWLLPSVELLIAAFLFIPGKGVIKVSKTYEIILFFRKIGLYGSFILMALFTFYISYMLLLTTKLPCSCGGIIEQMTWKQHLIFNIVFTSIAWTGIRLEKKERKQNGKEIQAVLFT